MSDLIFFLSLYFIYSNSNSINFDVIFKTFKLIDHNFSFFNKNLNSIEIIALTLFFSFLLRCRQFFILIHLMILKLNVSLNILLISALYMPVDYILFFVFYH